MDLLECEWAMLESIRDEGPVDLPFDSVQGLTRYHLLMAEERDGVYWWSLSREGEILLEQRREERSREDKKIQKPPDKNAGVKPEKNGDRSFQLFNTLLGAIISAALCVLFAELAENWAQVAAFISGLLG